VPMVASVVVLVNAAGLIPPPVYGRRTEKVVRKRMSVLVAAAMLLAAILIVASPASAQGGCQDFGTGVAENVQTGTLRQEIPVLARAGQLDEAVHSFHGALCG
jgi:MFS family permease